MLYYPEHEHFYFIEYDKINKDNNLIKSNNNNIIQNLNINNNNNFIQSKRFNKRHRNFN